MLVRVGVTAAGRSGWVSLGLPCATPSFCLRSRAPGGVSRPRGHEPGPGSGNLFVSRAARRRGVPKGLAACIAGPRGLDPQLIMLISALCLILPDGAAVQRGPAGPARRAYRRHFRRPRPRVAEAGGCASRWSWAPWAGRLGCHRRRSRCSRRGHRHDHCLRDHRVAAVAAAAAATAPVSTQCTACTAVAGGRARGAVRMFVLCSGARGDQGVALSRPILVEQKGVPRCLEAPR